MAEGNAGAQTTFLPLNGSSVFHDLNGWNETVQLI